MKKNVILIYDGSFEGFLTCIFTVFEQKLLPSDIRTEDAIQSDFFSETQLVVSDITKASRVKEGLLERISASGILQLYYVFLSERHGVELLLLHYIQLVFDKKTFCSTDFGNPIILKTAQIAKMVSREKHRMEAFVRFKRTKDNIYFAHIEPDFNVLPLILKHFESRYADQKWMIYDLRRTYGIWYNLHQTAYVTFDPSHDIASKASTADLYDNSEREFQMLWQQYFKSTNIPSRKNTRLHIQHVPKRYWKYLTEKSSLPD